MMKPTRFNRAPIIPSKKKYPLTGRSSKGTPLAKELKEEEEEEEGKEDDAEELLEVVEPKYFRFTSLRLLVWINFILVILLMISFLVYILTRSPTHPSLKSVDEYEGGKKMLLFNLIPDKESNDRWAIISLKSSEIDVHKLEDIWVCCTKNSIYSCDGYNVAFFLEKQEAKISIKHPDQIGSTCRLFWH